MAERIKIGTKADFPVGKLHKVDVQGKSVLVTEIDGKLCAVRNQCAHLPVGLEGGKIEDGAVVCPLHNSKYDLCSGENLDWVPGFLGINVPRWSRRLIAMGKQPQGIKAYTVIEEEDEVFVEV